MNFANPNAGFKSKSINANDEKAAETANNARAFKRGGEQGSKGQNRERERMNPPQQRRPKDGQQQQQQQQQQAPRAQLAPPQEPKAAAEEAEGKDDEPVDEASKHPLQNSWSFWYFEHDRSKSWEQNQNLINTFNYVEDFWSLFNHIKPPSDIAVGNDYSLFKTGIQPMWEDPANKEGGRWMLQIKNKNEVDHLWIDILLTLIGEAFDHSDDVCGVVVNMRRNVYKIAIWTADAKRDEAVLEIGRTLKESLNLNRVSLQYYAHKDSMVKTGSNTQAMHTL